MKAVCRRSFPLNAIIALAAVSLVFTAHACVTVNVNFPESAVQKAADDYVKDLYRAKEKGKTPAAEPSPAATHSSIWDFSIIQSASAADGVRVDSPKAMKIRERLSARLDEVLSYKRAGQLGETSEGLLAVRLSDPSKKLLQKKLEKLVADENADREELYKEVAASNGIPSARLKDIRRNFARSFQAESPSGTGVQDADGKWSQKP